MMVSATCLSATDSVSQAPRVIGGSLATYAPPLRLGRGTASGYFFAQNDDMGSRLGVPEKN